MLQGEKKKKGPRKSKEKKQGEGKGMFALGEILLGHKSPPSQGKRKVTDPIPEKGHGRRGAVKRKGGNREGFNKGSTGQVRNRP